MEYVWIATFLWGLKGKLKASKDERQTETCYLGQGKGKKRKICKIIPSTTSYLNHY